MITDSRPKTPLEVEKAYIVDSGKTEEQASDLLSYITESPLAIIKEDLKLFSQTNPDTNITRLYAVILMMKGEAQNVNSRRAGQNGQKIRWTYSNGI